MRIRGNAVSDEPFARPGDDASIEIDGRAIDVDDEHLGPRRPTGDHESPISRDVGDFDGIRIRCRLAEHDDPAKISVPGLHWGAEKVVALREGEVARRPESRAVEPVLRV